MEKFVVGFFCDDVLTISERKISPPTQFFHRVSAEFFDSNRDFLIFLGSKPIFDFSPTPIFDRPTIFLGDPFFYRFFCDDVVRLQV